MAAIVIAACGWAAPMASAQTGIGIGAINGPNPLPLHTAPAPEGDSSCGTRTTPDSAVPTSRPAPPSAAPTISGERRPGEHETGCVDALYSARQALEMFEHWLGRPAQRVAPRHADSGRHARSQSGSSIGTEIQIGRDGGRWAASMDVIGGALGYALFQKLMGQVAQAGVRIAAADIFGR